VLRRVAERCDPVRDTVRQLGPLDILDHAAPRLGVGATIGFDATRKIEGEQAAGIPIDPEGRARSLPDAEDAERILDGVLRSELVLDAALPEALGRGWLLVKIEKPRPHAARSVLDHVLKLGEQPAPPFVIALDESVDIHDTGTALFHWCANTAMQRDVISHDSGGESGVPRTRMGFDSTPKRMDESLKGMPVREWPPIIAMDAKTVEHVDRRWGEYGID
jgi:4-hydroxy-3-polyprenylbenzoate decarboxylase